MRFPFDLVQLQWHKKLCGISLPIQAACGRMGSKESVMCAGAALEKTLVGPRAMDL